MMKKIEMAQCHSNMDGLCWNFEKWCEKLWCTKKCSLLEFRCSESAAAHTQQLKLKEDNFHGFVPRSRFIEWVILNILITGTLSKEAGPALCFLIKIIQKVQLKTCLLGRSLVSSKKLQGSHCTWK